MANIKNTNTSQALQSLRDKMGQKQFRGSYVRTAQKLDCTSNWVWKVIHEKTPASMDVIEKIVGAGLTVLEEMAAEQQNTETKSNKLANMVRQRISAISA